MPTQIIDLFAGPGGLGEGFSSLNDGKAFKIALSAEMEASAHSTLCLRSFYRHVRDDPRKAAAYYSFCNGETIEPHDDSTRSAWKAASDEAQMLTLGDPGHNRRLDELLDARLKVGEDSVLIGGPPCQAYSLVGRARNVGKVDYRPESDHRHFLYREYLRIIQSRRPAVFVMENVKGILSSQVGGKHIFHEILRDLCDPDAALGLSGVGGVKYRIHSIVAKTWYEHGMDPLSIDPRDYIIRAEQHGLPQARHRVILLGIREDIPPNYEPLLRCKPSSVRDALTGLPDLRSSISRRVDLGADWSATVTEHLTQLGHAASANGDYALSNALWEAAVGVRADLSRGALRMPKEGIVGWGNDELRRWYTDDKLHVWLNHEARSHMSSDLRRYAYAAAYAKLTNNSPRGHAQFNLPGLRPNHENWESGKFVDRFKVQRYDEPSTTITSHISKDGHYFIHPDPSQCRSLTVREAARLQTFPDNYFFQGNRTQQYHQVGNAVPPLLAHRIARVVSDILG